MPPGNDDAEPPVEAGGEPHDAQSAYELGDRLAERGDLEGAEKAYRRADEGGHPTAAAKLGMLSEQRGEITEAEAAYRRADQRGDDLGAFRLGLLLSGRGEWQAANTAWSRAEDRGKHAPGLDLAAVLRRRDSGPTRRAAPGSAFANPVLIGAVTVLIILVAVFLAYNANEGLPFVPTKELKVDIADGSNLVVGNDVLEGGSRIGLLSAMKPIELSNGQVGAQLTLQLDQANGKVPSDSRVTILPRSVLGLKYVELERGTSRRLIADGGTLPLSQSEVPVQFDDIFKTFNKPTRAAIQQDLQGFGDTLAGRGSALNDTIHSLAPLLGHLRPVAQYLSDPGTQLTRFLGSLNAFMGTVAPVAGINARLFTDLATTFAAISKDPTALESTIAESPSTLSVSTDSLKTQQPLFVDLTTLGKNLTPATAELKAALPNINPAVEAGTVTLRRTPVLNAKLQQLMDALKKLAVAPGTNIAINALSSTAATLNPMIRYLGPYQTVCDYWNYWWTYLAEHLSEQTGYGFAQRAMLNFADSSQTDNVAAAGATAPAGTFGGPESLHAQPYGAAIDNQGNADCETGQRGYPKKLNSFDPQGRDLGVDPHTPGDQGPTFAGRARVPAGETFSRNPQTGPQLPYNPSNP
jgi:virulence factor Mce-like protein